MANPPYTNRTILQRLGEHWQSAKHLQEYWERELKNQVDHTGFFKEVTFDLTSDKPIINSIYLIFLIGIQYKVSTTEVLTIEPRSQATKKHTKVKKGWKAVEINGQKINHQNVQYLTDNPGLPFIKNTIKFQFENPEPVEQDRYPLACAVALRGPDKWAVLPLEYVPYPDPIIRETRKQWEDAHKIYESAWIQHLKTEIPWGLNKARATGALFENRPCNNSLYGF